MYQDEIIIEVWNNRKTYTKHYHHNLTEIIKNLKIRQKQSKKLIIDRRLPMSEV